MVLSVREGKGRTASHANVGVGPLWGLPQMLVPERFLERM